MKNEHEKTGRKKSNNSDMVNFTNKFTQKELPQTGTVVTAENSCLDVVGSNP